MLNRVKSFRYRLPYSEYVPKLYGKPETLFADLGGSKKSQQLISLQIALNPWPGELANDRIYVRLEITA
jgi:hypothetical protein